MSLVGSTRWSSATGVANCPFHACGLRFIYHFSRAHHKVLLQTIPVERTIEQNILGKVRGTKGQPTDRGIHALTRDFSTLTREKCHASSRPDPHETRISRVTRIVAGRVGSGQEDFKISRVGSGRVRRFFKISRVGSGRDRRFSKSRGSSRVASRRLELLAGRVGSGRVKMSRNSHGSGRVSEILLIGSNLVENRNSIWGVCAPRHGMFCLTEAGHANWYHVVGGLRGEKPPLREVGPSEQPQRGLRRPLAQPRPPATLRKQSRPPQSQFFFALHLESYTTNYHITTSLRSSTGISPSQLPVWRGGAGPAHPRDA